MSDLFGLSIKGVCEIVTINLTSTGGGMHRFINTVDPLTGSEVIAGGSTIEYLGNSIKSYPFATGGFTRGSESPDIKPQIEFPDFDFYLGAILEQNDDGVGAEVTRTLVLIDQIRENLPPLRTDRYVLYTWGGQAGVKLVLELATIIDFNPEGQFPGITLTRQDYPALGSGLMR